MAGLSADPECDKSAADSERSLGRCSRTGSRAEEALAAGSHARDRLCRRLEPSLLEHRAAPFTVAGRSTADDVEVETSHGLRDRAGGSAADRSVVHAGDGRELNPRAAEERFVGEIDLGAI